MKTNIIKGIFLYAIVYLTGTGSLAQPGTVTGFKKISQTQGNFTGTLDNYDLLGWQALTGLGDLDGDGTPDVAAGVAFDDDGGPERGAVWILFLNPDGTVKAHTKISGDSGSFGGVLNDFDLLGHSVATLGDLDGDGIADIAVGAIGDDDAGSQSGAVWILFLNNDGTVKSHRKITTGQSGFTGMLNVADWFGFSVAYAGDVNSDGVADLAVGARFDDDGGYDRGAVWLLFLNPDGTVKNHQKISSIAGAFMGNLMDGDYFGWSVASIGDLNADGIPDLAAGAPFDDDAEENAGAVWILFLKEDGTVKSHQKITASTGGFSPTLNSYDLFGGSLGSGADLNGDKIPDIAVGAYQDDDGGSDGSSRGAVWILFLNRDGTVGNFQKISQTQGNFSGVLNEVDGFGSALATPGDINADGLPDLAVGAYQDDDGGNSRGAVWILFLEAHQAALQVDFSINHVKCKGINEGSVIAMPSGGTPPYNFLWSNWQYGPTASGLKAGTYFVMVIDADNTIITDSVQISEPDLLNISLATTHISCHGMEDGSAEVSVAGGTLPYTYLWSTGSIQPAVGNLQSANYIVTVTDYNNCSDTGATIIIEPAELRVDTVLIKGVSFEYSGDGEISISISGGTPPHLYSWSNGASTSHVTGLKKGYYTVYISDANGCNMQMSFLVIESGISGREEFSMPYFFNVSTNPSSHYFTVTGVAPSTRGQNDVVEITFTDLRGRLLLAEKVYTTGGVFQKKCDLSAAEEGMYILAIRDAQKILYHQKMVVR